jgi:hypothetical protein
MRLTLLVACLVGCVSCADIQRSANERAAVKADLRGQISASEPRCNSDVSCAILWEAAKHWAEYYPGRVAYFANSTRITMMDKDNWGMDIHLIAEGPTRVLRADKTCGGLVPCFNQAAAAILDLNASVNKAIEGK